MFTDPTGHDGLAGLLVDIGIEGLEDSIELPAVSSAVAAGSEVGASASVADSAAMLLARGATYFATVYGAATTLIDGAYAASSIIEKAVDDAIWNEVLTHALNHQVLSATDFKYLNDLAQKDLGESIYLHYSFVSQAANFAFGMRDATQAPPLGSYVTTDTYLTGWDAHNFLALPSSNIQDAEYIVLVKRGLPAVGPSLVPAGFDGASPPRSLQGGGIQYTLPQGSGGPGTVFGPIPLPPGSVPS